MLKKMKNRKGFTLAELLIVVAIIAVLVAIAIPIFTSQLEKSREATDAANIRAAYAEVMVAGLSEDTDNYEKEVSLHNMGNDAYRNDDTIVLLLCNGHDIGYGIGNDCNRNRNS